VSPFSLFLRLNDKLMAKDSFMLQLFFWLICYLCPLLVPDPNVHTSLYVLDKNWTQYFKFCLLLLFIYNYVFVVIYHRQKIFIYIYFLYLLQIGLQWLSIIGRMIYLICTGPLLCSPTHCFEACICYFFQSLGAYCTLPAQPNFQCLSVQ